MIVWLSDEGLGKPVREGDVVFVESEGAYAAVRVVGSGFEITDDDVSDRSKAGSLRVAPPGSAIVPEDVYAPVILEVMAKSAIGDFKAFKRRVKACEVKMKGSILSYRSVYGDRLTLDTRYEKTPTINGEPVDYAPPFVHKSPFVNAAYNSGVVTISKGPVKKVLDFTSAGGESR